MEKDLSVKRIVGEDEVGYQITGIIENAEANTSWTSFRPKPIQNEVSMVVRDFVEKVKSIFG